MLLCTSAQALCSSPTLGPAARPSKVSWSLCSRGSIQPLQLPRPRHSMPLRVAAALKDEGGDKNESGPGRDAFRSSPALPAFTRRREHTIGRVAAVGFAFSLVGELLTGIGPITQLHYETGLSYKWLYVAVVALMGWGPLGATLPVSPTYDPRNLRDVQKRLDVNPLKNPRKFLVQNEVLVGRLAMAGFLGACLLEYIWGGEGPLAHLGLIQPGTQLLSAPWWTISLVGIFLANGLGLFSALGDRSDDDAF